MTRQQKLWLYRVGICPRMSWDLAVNNLPLSWVTGTLEATVTRFLKRWSGLAKTADTARLYLPNPKEASTSLLSPCCIRSSKSHSYGPGCEVHYHSRDQERGGSPAGNPPTNVGSTRHPRRRPRHEQASTDDKSQVSYGERGC